MRHQQVVVAYDGSALGAAVLARAVALVSRAPSHVLHFVAVVDPHHGIAMVPTEGSVDHRYADRVRDVVSDHVRQAFGATPIPDEIHFFVHARIGKPVQEILAVSEELGADLILIGTHGHTGIERLVLGSTAEHVVRAAGCPVLVVRPKKYDDVELATITEVRDHAPHRSRPYRFSYQNTNVIMRPPEWPIS